MQPDETRPDKLKRQAKANARAGLKPHSGHYLPSQDAVRLHEQAAVAGRTEIALARIKDVAREIMETGADLTAAERTTADARAAATDEELARGRAAAEDELATARQAHEKLMLDEQTPAEREPDAPDEANHEHTQPAEPAADAQPTYSSPFGWLAKLELPVLFAIGLGEYGFTYQASRVTLMPGAYLADFTRALVVATLAGGFFSGRWFRWRAATLGDERIGRRWNFLAPAVAFISGVLVALATARMREAYLRSNYEVAQGAAHDFVMQTNFIPWLTVLGVALAGLAFGLSYICASSPAHPRHFLQLSAAWLKQSQRKRAQRRTWRQARRDAEQAREATLAASRMRLSAAGESLAALNDADASAQDARADAQALEDQCWKRLAGLVPELLAAEQAVVTAIEIQVASGNATSRTFAQETLQESARKERGLSERFHDWTRGIKPQTLELKDPPPVVEGASPETIMAQVRAITAPARRVLIKRGLLDPEDVTAAKPADSLQGLDVSSNGHIPNPPSSIASEEGAS